MKQEYLDKLVKSALAIEARDAKEAGVMGFMGRALVQATLPHSKTVGNEFTRKNGAFTLTILSPSEIGLPYGNIPRLLMAWVTTEAVRTRDREILLGKSLSEFMHNLDLVPTGGRWGSITRLKEQMRRLFASTISLSYCDKTQQTGVNLQIAEQYQLWWTPKDPSQKTLWNSTLTLSQPFFQEIIDRPVPLDMAVLKAIKKSPLALDIYCWLTYRMSYLSKTANIPWIALQAQFGCNYAADEQGGRNFKKAFLRELKKINLFYPDAKILIEQEGLQLNPSSTPIKHKK